MGGEGSEGKRGGERQLLIYSYERGSPAFLNKGWEEAKKENRGVLARCKIEINKKGKREIESKQN